MQCGLAPTSHRRSQSQHVAHPWRVAVELRNGDQRALPVDLETKKVGRVDVDLLRDPDVDGVV